jgi:uncharacterized Fe-S cluster-containing radical SAM superfamily enzyme
MTSRICTYCAIDRGPYSRGLTFELTAPMTALQECEHGAKAARRHWSG